MTPLLSAYYLLVGFIFYRHDLRSRISRWRSPPDKILEGSYNPTKVNKQDTNDSGKFDTDLISASPSNSYEDEPEEPWENEEMMQQLEELSSHLKFAIDEAHEKEYSKEEFILLAQMTFREYPAIYGTPFQLSVNHLIEAELAKYGSIHLSGEDRLRMWNQVD